MLLLLAGCGGTSTRLPVLTALQLSRLAADVAAGRGCGAPLLRATVAAINRRQVPAPLQERLLGDANQIAATCSRKRARELAAWLSP